MGVIERIVPINRDNYVSGTVYDKLNIVRHNGKVWQSKVNNNSDVPTDTSDKWMFLVQDGYGSNWSDIGDKPFENYDSATLEKNGNNLTTKYKVEASTTDIAVGSSLETNKIYIVYEV